MWICPLALPVYSPIHCPFNPSARVIALRYHHALILKRRPALNPSFTFVLSGNMRTVAEYARELSSCARLFSDAPTAPGTTILLVQSQGIISSRLLFTTPAIGRSKKLRSW